MKFTLTDECINCSDIILDRSFQDKSLPSICWSHLKVYSTQEDISVVV